tara:strand:- start:1744 stop:2442 length:699 start_codon:yes stop_codon:yes gene_type:complete
MKRVLEAEMMDDPDLDDHHHREALAGLHRINIFSGVEKTIWPLIRNLFHGDSSSLSLLDIACGSGEIPIKLAQRASSLGFHLDLAGCDFSPLARQVALEKSNTANLKMKYQSIDVRQGSLAAMGQFDVVMCNLFLHHLEEHAAIHVLREASKITKRLLIVNDIRRDWINLILAKTVPRILTRSKVVHVDAVRSVRAAYSESEFRMLANNAGLPNARLRTVFPKRMILTWSPR